MLLPGLLSGLKGVWELELVPQRSFCGDELGGLIHSFMALVFYCTGTVSW